MSPIEQQPTSGDPVALVERALDAHLAGQLDAAESQYRRVLEQFPDHPSATHFLGILLHQKGHSEEGVLLVRKSIDLVPELEDWHNDLGNILAASKRDDEAAAAFMAALQINPNNPVVWNNLGAVLLSGGQVEEATISFENAIALDPGFEDALHTLGRIEEAAQVYRLWLREEPANPIAQHMLAACTGQDVPEQAANAYVETHFDQYANTFETKLVDSLSYRIPEKAGQALKNLAIPAGTLNVLDAGCGTGLCGPHLAPYAKHLVGVDLSAKSLAVAAEKAVYDELVKAELVEYLSVSAGSTWFPYLRPPGLNSTRSPRWISGWNWGSPSRACF